MTRKETQTSSAGWYCMQPTCVNCHPITNHILYLQLYIYIAFYSCIYIWSIYIYDYICILYSMHVIQTIQKLLAFKASMAVRVRSKISLEDLTCFSVVTGWTNWNLETQQRYSNDAIWLEMARLEVAVCWILGHWEDVMCLRGLVLGKVAGSGKISSNRESPTTPNFRWKLGLISQNATEAPNVPRTTSW